MLDPAKLTAAALAKNTTCVKPDVAKLVAGKPLAGDAIQITGTTTPAQPGRQLRTRAQPASAARRALAPICGTLNPKVEGSIPSGGIPEDPAQARSSGVEALDVDGVPLGD